MAADPYQGMTQDGIFKMLTWFSPALTGMFGLPPIVGEPLQQETHEPIERKFDRLYRLADGSYLNVEHQTKLNDRNGLAERMIKYRARARGKLPVPTVLRQVVVFTGAEPKDRSKVPGILSYDDRTPDDQSGITFTARVKDLLAEPVASFKASGSLDDLMLGLLGPGRSDPAYREDVASRVRALTGEAQRDAKVKFVTICATIGLTVDQLVGDVRMWIEDVKDSPVVKEIVRIAGREEREVAERKGMARSIVSVASSRSIPVRKGMVDDLVLYADSDALQAMMSGIDALTDDLDAFVKDHGVDLPTYGH